MQLIIGTDRGMKLKSWIKQCEKSEVFKLNKEIKVFFENNEGLKRKIYTDGSTLYLCVAGKVKGKSNIKMLFLYGTPTRKNITELKKSLGLLVSNQTGGLLTLLKYSSEKDPSYQKSPEKNQFISGFSGNFESELKVEDDRVLYSIELCSIGSKGSAYFDLGIATKSRISAVRKIVEVFENDYFYEFTRRVKEKKMEGDIES